MIAGKTATYEKVVVEMTTASTVLKKLWRLPEVSRKLRTRKMLATIPERTFTGTGVPNRFEKWPSGRGPEPASELIAIARSDPISQTTPLARSEKTTARPTLPFQRLAAPPPKTLVTTVW